MTWQVCQQTLRYKSLYNYWFCPRQWALIHLEHQWEDNRLTIEGQLLHKHVDDPFYRQKCGDYITLRSVNIASKELGLYGISDAIELLPSEDVTDTIRHPKYPGHWIPVPVEYKHGKPKKTPRVGVWIETTMIYSPSVGRWVTPRVGVWIETGNDNQEQA